MTNKLAKSSKGRFSKHDQKRQFYEIARENGETLADIRTQPLKWSPRGGLVFKSRDLAEDVVNDLFVGPVTAARLGISIRAASRFQHGR